MSYGSSDNVTCRTVCPIPADHSREALGDLAAPCSKPKGHHGDHGNGLSVWENVGASLRADAERERYRDVMVLLARCGSVTALRVLCDALVPVDDMSEAAQNKRIAVWGCLDGVVDFAHLAEEVAAATQETAAIGERAA